MMKKYWLATIVCVLFTAVSWHHAMHAQLQHADARENPSWTQIESDRTLLLQTADAIITGPVQIITKGFADLSHVRDQQAFLRLARHISHELQIPENGLIQSLDGRPLYQSEQQADGIAIQLRMILSGEHTGTLLLTVDSSHTQVSESARANTLQKLDQTLEQVNLTPRWFTSVTGKTALNEPAFRPQIEATLHTIRVESYQDLRTTSISYYSPMFHQTIMTGNRPMNVQVALHEDTAGGEWTATLGTPMIAITY